MTIAEIARLIDHTLLKAEATRRDIETLCHQALQFEFASVCVNPCYVRQAAEVLRGSRVCRVCAVVGFPLGATLTSVKVFEANEAMRLGAREVDMVIHVGALKSGDAAAVEADIRAVAEASHRSGAICKVIIEAPLLIHDEKILASRAAMNAGADFVKTATGFGPGGATVEDVQLIRRVVGPHMGLKAAGGIGTWHDFQQMLAAGATRIGTSSSLKILEQAEAAAAGQP